MLTKITKLKYKNNQMLIQLVLLIFIIFQLFWFDSPKTNLEKTKVRLMNNPSSIVAHLKLAELAANYQDWKLAKSELRIASKLAGFSQISDPDLSLRFKRADKQINYEHFLKEEAFRWTQLTKIQPSYRDGFLQLALIYYQLNNIDLAITYWDIAWKLDPNNEYVISVGKLLKEV